MESLQLTVKRVSSAEVPASTDTTSVPTEAPSDLGQVLINGPIASVVSQMLLTKYGHQEGTELAQESWELTVGDLSMRAMEEGEGTVPELWVYVLNGRSVTNADVLAAQEAFGRAPGTATKMLVVEAHLSHVNEHVEALVRFAHEHHIPTKMSVSGAMYAIERHFDQLAKSGA